MKVTHITLENFKRFERLEIEVRNNITQDVADQFLILGDNGTGKTTVLQAIALTLGLASRMISSVETFDWLGWMPGRYERWGTPRVELEVSFTEKEIEATREASARLLKAKLGSQYILPGDSKRVKIRLEGGQVTADSADEFFQFQGRSCAAQLLKSDPSARNLFKDLPGVFWFDQFRNLATVSNIQNGQADARADRTFRVGVDRLREYLNKWQIGKLEGGRTYRRDFISELEEHYKRIFPGRRFADPEPMYDGDAPTPIDYYFMLSDGHRTYDLVEMSAGEQAVFPMLYEFVRLQIRNSIVLIDEIDLNLHPPLAQSLLSALPSLGPDCQFFLTTHADAISEMVSPAEVYRLPGGHLCL